MSKFVELFFLLEFIDSNNVLNKAELLNSCHVIIPDALKYFD